MDAHDRRAHERLDNLESVVKTLAEEQEAAKAALAENTEMIRQLVKNTQELVDLVRGVKGFRALILWITPVVAAGYALWAWVKQP